MIQFVLRSDLGVWWLCHTLIVFIAFWDKKPQLTKPVNLLLFLQSSVGSDPPSSCPHGMWWAVLGFSHSNRCGMEFSVALICTSPGNNDIWNFSMCACLTHDWIQGFYRGIVYKYILICGFCFQSLNSRFIFYSLSFGILRKKEWRVLKFVVVVVF